MNFDLNENQKMFRDMVRDFAAKEIAPIAQRMDEEAAMPESLIAKMRDNGFFGLSFPEKYGGLGVDTLTYSLVVEELAKASAGVCVVITVHNSVGSYPLAMFGDEGVKERFLPRMATGEIAAFCSSDGAWLPLMCTMNCTVATELMRDLLGADLAAFEQQIGSAPRGSGGVLTLPFFNGERTPNLQYARGCIVGCMKHMEKRGRVGNTFRTRAVFSEDEPGWLPEKPEPADHHGFIYDPDAEDEGKLADQGTTWY